MGITTVATGVDNSYVPTGIDCIIFHPSLLLFFLSVPEPLNANPFISPPHTRQRPLLLCILYAHLHRAPTFACASMSTCRSFSTPMPRSFSTSKRPGTAPSARPSPSRSGTVVETTLLLRPVLLRHQVHASSTSSTCSSSANPHPLSFPLPL
jgi:hypothetical protein